MKGRKISRKQGTLLVKSPSSEYELFVTFVST